MDDMWVFLHPCGCAFGMANVSAWYPTAGRAWRALYDTRDEAAAARADGVTLIRATHEQYARDHIGHIKRGCRHRAKGASA